MSDTIIHLSTRSPENCATCCRWGIRGSARFAPFCYEHNAYLPAPLVEHGCSRYQRETVDSDAVALYEQLSAPPSDKEEGEDHPPRSLL